MAYLLILLSQAPVLYYDLCVYRSIYRIAVLTLRYISVEAIGKRMNKVPEFFVCVLLLYCWTIIYKVRYISDYLAELHPS